VRRGHVSKPDAARRLRPSSGTELDFIAAEVRLPPVMAPRPTSLVRHPIPPSLLSLTRPGSACTCKGEDHPGPDTGKGRGAPEIDIIEAERNKNDMYFGGLGQVVSQSAQFAPFTHDYRALNDTVDQWTTYSTSSFISVGKTNADRRVDTNMTWPNSYRGSAV
jgi:hypothetical protein